MPTAADPMQACSFVRAAACTKSNARSVLNLWNFLMCTRRLLELENTWLQSLHSDTVEKKINTYLSSYRFNSWSYHCRISLCWSDRASFFLKQCCIVRTITGWFLLLPTFLVLLFRKKSIACFLFEAGSNFRPSWLLTVCLWKLRGVVFRLAHLQTID